jgi:hypothetical protein
MAVLSSKRWHLPDLTLCLYITLAVGYPLVYSAIQGGLASPVVWISLALRVGLVTALLRHHRWAWTVLLTLDLLYLTAAALVGAPDFVLAVVRVGLLLSPQVRRYARVEDA